VRVGLASKIKSLVVPQGKIVRSIQVGPLRGLKMNLDLAYETQMFLGLAEREIHPVLRQFSRDARTAVDVGAAFGEYVLFFLTRTPAKQIFAFEPEPQMRAPLDSNLALNGVQREPRLRFSSQYVGATNDERTITLDSLAHQIEPPCIIKVDVDGAEMDVLKGASHLLGSTGIRWIVETHSRLLEDECMGLFQNTGYDTKIIPNAWWRLFLPEQRPIEHNRWLLATKEGPASDACARS
jgi:FkbM family methyltransferase